MEFLLLALLGAAGIYIFLRGGEVPAWVNTETVSGQDVQVVSTTDAASRAQYGLIYYGKAVDEFLANPIHDRVTGTNMKIIDDTDTSLGGVMSKAVVKYKDPRLVFAIDQLASLLDAIPVSASNIPQLPNVDKLPDTITLFIYERADAAALATKGSNYAVLGTAAQKQAPLPGSQIMD